jgi:hypothetical protein
MDLSFTDAMNYALEHLSKIQVDGLPGFKTHIAFLPCNTRVESGCSTPGSSFSSSSLSSTPEYSFKPKITVMSIQDAYELYELDQTGGPILSEFITKIAGKPLPCLTDRKTELSYVDMTRLAMYTGWPEVGEFHLQGGRVGLAQDADERLDEQLDGSQSATCKISVFS